MLGIALATGQIWGWTSKTKLAHVSLLGECTKDTKLPACCKLLLLLLNHAFHRQIASPFSNETQTFVTQPTFPGFNCLLDLSFFGLETRTLCFQLPHRHCTHIHTVGVYSLWDSVPNRFLPRLSGRVCVLHWGDKSHLRCLHIHTVHTHRHSLIGNWKLSSLSPREKATSTEAWRRSSWLFRGACAKEMPMYVAITQSDSHLKGSLIPSNRRRKISQTTQIHTHFGKVTYTDRQQRACELRFELAISGFSS